MIFRYYLIKYLQKELSLIPGQLKELSEGTVKAYNLLMELKIDPAEYSSIENYNNMVSMSLTSKDKFIRKLISYIRLWPFQRNREIAS